MIKISSAQRENIKMTKPKNLADLHEKICLIYNTKVVQLVLTYENDEEEQVLLLNDLDYQPLVSSDRDYLIRAYIKPLSSNRKLH